MTGTDPFGLSDFYEIEFDIVDYPPEKGADDLQDISVYLANNISKQQTVLDGNYTTDIEGDHVYY